MHAVSVLLILDALDVDADDDGRSCVKVEFNEWNGTVETENLSSARLSHSPVPVVEISEFDVRDELDVRTMSDILAELGAFGVETNDAAGPIKRS